MSTHQGVSDGQCLRVQLLGEEIWKPLNIPTGIFPSPFGQQRLSGEISFALSQSEKFLRGILVLGKRNQTPLIPSGPMLLVKHSESQFGWSSLGPWGGSSSSSSGVQRISPVAQSPPRLAQACDFSGSCYRCVNTLSGRQRSQATTEDLKPFLSS